MAYPRIYDSPEEASRARNRRYRERHREQIRKRQREWRRAYLAENRDDINRRRREQYAANPQPYRERARQYASANLDKRCEIENRRRAVLNGSPVIERVDRSVVYTRDGGRCHICGRKVDPARFEAEAPDVFRPKLLLLGDV